MDKEEVGTGMHRVAVDMYKMEKDQYWVRCNVFLLLNSALLVAFNSDKTQGSILLVIPVMGAILSAAWLMISVHAEYYIKRWREIIRNIEVDLPVQPFLSFPKDSVHFASPAGERLFRILVYPYRWLLRGGPSRVMNAVIVVVMAMWILLGINARPGGRRTGQPYPGTTPAATVLQRDQQPTSQPTTR